MPELTGNFSTSPGLSMPIDGFDTRFTDLLPTAVLVVREGILRYLNPAARRLLEIDPAVPGASDHLMDYVHELDKARARHRLSAMENSAPDAPIAKEASEFRVVTARRKLRIVMTNSAAIALADGPAVVITAEDMTHQSQMEDQLRESEREFRRLFENLQDVYYRTDALGVVQKVGPGVCKVLGYEPCEIEGQDAAFYYPQSKDREALKQAIAAYGEVSDFPGQMVRRDGQVIDISISSHALFDAQGRFAGVEGVWRDVTQRKNMERELYRLATTDTLTGIANRRNFLDRARQFFDDAARQQAPMCLLMLDLDHFKSVNDRHGHLQGDQVLVRFAQTVAALLNDDTIFGRLGGEEFGIGLPATPGDAASMAQQLQAKVRLLRFSDGWGGHYGITTSIGMACAQPGDQRFDSLLENADRALYAAKRAGRDCIVADNGGMLNG
ncbi:sensor domain-containing diguanylate cyclase [Variovorax sp. PvP013]|uniref:sensor domain-containing diguanylate cyclase n=1 Tax=Variovorax sp. PvP013 TaxID=3156435 RepID=UPI003D2609B2